MENLPPISNTPFTQMICMPAYNNNATMMSSANTKVIEFVTNWGKKQPQLRKAASLMMPSR